MYPHRTGGMIQNKSLRLFAIAKIHLPLGKGGKRATNGRPYDDTKPHTCDFFWLLRSKMKVV